MTTGLTETTLEEEFVILSIIDCDELVLFYRFDRPNKNSVRRIRAHRNEHSVEIFASMVDESGAVALSFHINVG